MVQNQGMRLNAGCIVALALRNAARQDAPCRAGFTVSGKVGNAVTRNRVRRHLREAYRHQRGTLPQGVDVVFIARQSAASAEGAVLKQAVDELCRGLIRRFRC